jgi:hypothetical protein
LNRSSVPAWRGRSSAPDPDFLRATRLAELIRGKVLDLATVSTEPPPGEVE